MPRLPTQPTQQQADKIHRVGLSCQVTSSGKVWCFFSPAYPKGAFARYRSVSGHLTFFCGTYADCRTNDAAVDLVLIHAQQHGLLPPPQQPPPRQQQSGLDGLLNGPWQQTSRNGMMGGPSHERQRQQQPPHTCNGHAQQHGPQQGQQQAGPADDDDDDDDDFDNDRHTPHGPVTAPVHLIWDMYMRIVAENSCPENELTEDRLHEMAYTSIKATEVFFEKINGGPRE